MKHFIVAAIFIITLAFPAAVHAAEAPLLNADTQFSSSFGSAAISDQNRSTKQVLTGENEISFEAMQGISSIYFIWDDAPESWALTDEGGNIVAVNSNDHFLHEYVAPFENDAGESVTYNKLTLKVTGGTLCDIYLFARGDAPDYVQKWHSPYTDADMLVLPTHADDEHLYFGGTMPLYSADKKIQVAYLTNHNGEKYRRHELLDGLWAVGITGYPIISDFRDAYADTLQQAKQLYPEQDVLEYQVMLLRRFKPEVVIAHDLNGEYGHGAHKYNAHSLQKALVAAADINEFPELYGVYGIFDTPKAYFHLMEENEIIMDWSVPLSHFGGKTALDVAKLGYDAHKSQHQWSFAVEDFGPYDCRKFGLYKSTVGEDILKNDFYENIAPEMYSDYIAPPPPPISQQPIQSEVLSKDESAAIKEIQAAEKKHNNSIYFICAALFILPALAGAIFIAIRNKKR